MGRGPAHTNTHTHSAHKQIHKGFAFRLTKSPFGFTLRNLLACFRLLLLLLLLPFPFYFVFYFVSIWGKSLVIITSQPAVCPATRRAPTFLSLATFLPSQGGEHGAQRTAQSSCSSAEQFWGLTLTRLRHTRARTLKMGVEVRPTTRTRHLDECCLLSLGFGV